MKNWAENDAASTHESVLKWNEEMRKFIEEEGQQGNCFYETFLEMKDRLSFPQKVKRYLA